MLSPHQSSGKGGVPQPWGVHGAPRLCVVYWTSHLIFKSKVTHRIFSPAAQIEVREFKCLAQGHTGGKWLRLETPQVQPNSGKARAVSWDVPEACPEPQAGGRASVIDSPLSGNGSAKLSEAGRGLENTVSPLNVLQSWVCAKSHGEALRVPRCLLNAHSRASVLRNSVRAAGEGLWLEMTHFIGGAAS